MNSLRSVKSTHNFYVFVTVHPSYNNINNQLDATVPPHPGHQSVASPVHYTRSCKHSLVLLRMGEIIARNMLS
jgi:hypothetical protein